MNILTILCLAMCLAAPDTDIVVVRGETVYTMAGPPIPDGYVRVEDGIITEVGDAANLVIPTGARTHRAAVVTPGLIDARTCLGLAGHLNTDHDRDELDPSSPVQPQLRAIDAYHPHDRLVEWVRGFGVTTIHTGHAPEALISGQTMVVKTTGNRVEDTLLDPRAMISCSLGETAIRDDSPGTRAKAFAMLRQRLLDARHYAAAKQTALEGDSDAPKTDLELEALAGVLRGETPLLVHAHRSRDLANALRLREEFGITIVLDGACEALTLQEEIKAAGIPVLIHATMIRPYGERENLSFETAAKLIAAGIPVAMQSGYESYVPRARVVLYEAGMAAANGCSFEDALGMITIQPARILGIDDRVGSLEVGKHGDLALYDGDPFEWTTHCTGVLIDGELVSSGPR